MGAVVIEELDHGDSFKAVTNMYGNCYDKIVKAFPAETTVLGLKYQNEIITRIAGRFAFFNNYSVFVEEE